MEKTLFTLPDHNKNDTPFIELHFYNWMKEKGIKSPDRIETKKAYLDDIGFNKEIHTLGEDWENDMKILNYCMDWFYRTEIIEKNQN